MCQVGFSRADMGITHRESLLFFQLIGKDPMLGVKAKGGVGWARALKSEGWGQPLRVILSSSQEALRNAPGTLVSAGGLSHVAPALPQGHTPAPRGPEELPPLPHPEQVSRGQEPDKGLSEAKPW